MNIKFIPKDIILFFFMNNLFKLMVVAMEFVMKTCLIQH